MMRLRKATSVLVLLALPVAGNWSRVLADTADPPRATTLGADRGVEPGAVIPEDPEQFRMTMLRFVAEMDETLQRALAHPALATRARAVMSPSDLVQIPLGRDAYAALEEADTYDLQQLRDVTVQYPDLLELPKVLDEALSRLSLTDVGGRERGACGDNYAEFAKTVGLQASNRALTRAINTLAIVYSILDTVTEVVGAATEDAPYVGKRPSLPLIIIRGILGFVNTILGISHDVIAFEIELSQLCVAACLSDDADVHGQPSARWRGRGCDNRDNNCVGGTDDPAEDLFAPELYLDATLIGQCFPTAVAAQDAVTLAVKASDDCSDPAVGVTVGPVSPDTCQAVFSVTATDGSGNISEANAAYQQVLVDGAPPQIATPALSACYATVAAARAALTGPGFAASDCTAIDLDIDAIEKECVTDFELTATDACGNRTQIRDRARIDADAPSVDIERLALPAVDGLTCFDTEESAVAAVSEASVFSDRCTASADLVTQVTTSGPACDLLVTSSAVDECGNAASDSLQVRVDPAAPVVTCNVGTPILYPATSAFVDVGFSYTAFDNCEPGGPSVRVEVTSDEPTLLAYSVIPGADPFPDARLTRAADGTVERIELRAQRSQSADGRVYRIRVVATDSCGLETYDDCFVSVPRSQPGPGSAINSGQRFDATKQN